MSRNGSGTYSLPAGNPVVTGTTISSTWANNTMNDLAAALTDSVAADGQTPMTGNLNLSNNKIVNLATPTVSTDAVTKAYADALVGGTGAGSFTTLTVSGASSLAATTITGTTTLATSLTGILKGTSGVVSVATAGTDYAGISNVQTFTAGQRGGVSALTSASTITPNLATANNFSLTLDTNATLANPTNIVAGQSGVIVITQDGTGGRTLAFGSYWDFSGGTAPTLTTAASAVDVLVYYVNSTTSITASLISNIS
jgi:hypothetical protein